MSNEHNLLFEKVRSGAVLSEQEFALFQTLNNNNTQHLQQTTTTTITREPLFGGINPYPTFTNPKGYAYRGSSDCRKCNGLGYKVSKRKGGKYTSCKSCMQSLGYCPKCNSTGFNTKNGKACNCKIKLAKREENKLHKLEQQRIKGQSNILQNQNENHLLQKEMIMQNNLNNNLHTGQMIQSNEIIHTNSGLTTQKVVLAPFTNPKNYAYQGVPGCKKCNGVGYKVSKRGKHTACKSCMKALGHCPKCNSTGIKLRNGKVCNCKEKLLKREEKKRIKEEARIHKEEQKRIKAGLV